jgi:hypothetical protein
MPEKMKSLLFVALALVAGNLHSQELNLGGLTGLGFLSENGLSFNIGAVVEYRPNNALFSINNEIDFLVVQDEFLLTYPLYLKFIIGKKFRFCPSLGGFFRSNLYYGWLAGAEFDYSFKNKITMFLAAELMQDYYKEDLPTHQGETYNITTHENSYWLSVGIKKNILKPNKD